MSGLIDTHAHIYLADFDEDRGAVVDRAIEANVEAVLLPNVDQTTVQRMYDLCDAYPDFAFPMMGLHPTSVDENYIQHLNQIESYLPTRMHHAIGEVGLDLYWDKTFAREQVETFMEQMRWAMTLNLPVVIHTREAYKEVFDCVHRVGDARLRGVFHCFSGSADDLREIIGFQSFKVGIGGVVTFKNSNLRDILKETPALDKLLLETDAPYLSPVPYRGKRNEPAYMTYTVKKLAEVFEMEVEQLQAIVHQNTLDLFQTLPR